MTNINLSGFFGASYVGYTGSQGIQGIQGIQGTTGAGFSDGDKGDVTISSSGTVFTIDNGVITTEKLATLSPGVVISGSSTSDALRITQTGTGNSLVVEDDTNPDATRFAINGTGDVGMGVAPVNNAGFTGIRIGNSTGGLIDFISGTATHGRIFNSTTSFIVESGIGAATAIPLVFRTNASTERLRIIENGAWGLAGNNYGTAGQVIASNGSGSAPSWQNININDLGDVVITSPASTQVLTYNGTNWVNSAAGGGGGIASGKAIILSMIFG